MPLYEYECQACGHRFERIRKFADPPLAICPQCGGAIEKLVSSPAFHLKGSGWYATDYGKKDTEGTDKGPAKGTESTGKGTEGAEKNTEKTEKSSKSEGTERAAPKEEKKEEKKKEEKKKSEKADKKEAPKT